MAMSYERRMARWMKKRDIWLKRIVELINESMVALGSASDENRRCISHRLDGNEVIYRVEWMKHKGVKVSTYRLVPDESIETPIIPQELPYGLYVAVVYGRMEVVDLRTEEAAIHQTPLTSIGRAALHERWDVRYTRSIDFELFYPAKLLGFWNMRRLKPPPPIPL